LPTPGSSFFEQRRQGEPTRLGKRSAGKWVQPEHYQIVGATLTAAWQRAKLTQVELAARLGKPQSFVSEYENGRRRVDLVEFLLIVGTLGADPANVFAEIVASIPRETRAARP
jgi:predicted transcriptional regulator